MPFTPNEIEQWHRERRTASDKIEAERARHWEEVRRASAIAVCISCHNPFGINEGYISDEVEMCYVCIGD
jgi:cytochrome c553